MPSIKNQQALQSINEKMDRAQALYFVNYQGLTHQQLEEARRELRDNDSEIAVLKNTLTNIALQQRNVDASDRFDGPYATLFAYADPVKTAKILVDFNKKYQLPEIKWGVYEGKIIDEATVKELASVPPKEVLLAKLVGMMKSPMNGLVYSLNYNITKLALVLKSIEEKKGANN